MSVVQQHRSQILGITFTGKAKEHVLHYVKQQHDCKGIRFSVKKTGCSGFSYSIDYVVTHEPTDLVFSLEGIYQVYIDKNSYPYLKGLQVDLAKTGLQTELVFSNPNQLGQCGCGKSFTVKKIE
jgi:iron-sulfur cluster assembly protein